jgi:hypothetical protein
MRRTVVAITIAVMILGLVGCGLKTSPSTSSSTPSPAPSTSGSPSLSAQPGPASPATSTATAPVKVEKPVAPEVNPPGDIPDSQVFVAYRAPGRFVVKVPEGWSRSTLTGSARFNDKLNTISLRWSKVGAAPTVAEVKASEIAALRAAGGAFKLVSVKAVKLPSGPAVLVTYQVNSAPNSVTGKQYRLDALRYSLFHHGVRLDITLTSPVGADNVDPWNTVVRSVTWQ